MVFECKLNFFKIYRVLIKRKMECLPPHECRINAFKIQNVPTNQYNSSKLTHFDKDCDTYVCQNVSIYHAFNDGLNVRVVFEKIISPRYKNATPEICSSDLLEAQASRL